MEENGLLSDDELRNIIASNQSNKSTTPPINRARQISKENSTYKKETLTLLDIDTSILEYLEYINLTVDVDGVKKKVPIIYGDSEKWRQASSNGYIKDAQGQVQIPLIMFRRTSMSRRDDIIRPMNINERISYTTGYSAKNRFDKFSQQIGLEPTKEIYKVRLGDFVQMDYEFMIWTDFVAHSNQLIEQLNWNSKEYWGLAPGKRFRSTIDSYSTNTTVSDTDDRLVRTDFQLNVKGYLIPDNVDDRLNDEAVLREYTTQKVVMFVESETDSIVSDDLSVRQNLSSDSNRIGALFNREVFTSNNTSASRNLEFESVVDFLSLSELRTATITSTSNVTFANQRVATIPTVTYLDIDDSDLFQVFINNVFVPSNIWSYSDNGTDLIFTFNTSLLGYQLDATTDTVKAIGKFVNR